MKVAPASPVTRTRLWRLPCSILNAAASSRAGRRRRIPAVRAASAWPGHAVTFIVPFPPGGPVDTTARFATQPLGRLWSVPTVVDNKSGAGGIVGAQFAAKAEPDGYSLFFASIHHAVLPSLRDNLSYDILRDFEPVGMAAVFPIVLVVNPSMPVNSVSELIAYARLSPASCRSARRARAAARIWPANCSMPWPEPGSSTCRIAAARPPCRTWWADRCS